MKSWRCRDPLKMGKQIQKPRGCRWYCFLFPFPLGSLMGAYWVSHFAARLEAPILDVPVLHRFMSPQCIRISVYRYTAIEHLSLPIDVHLCPMEPEATTQRSSEILRGSDGLRCWVSNFIPNLGFPLRELGGYLQLLGPMEVRRLEIVRYLMVVETDSSPKISIDSMPIA